MKITFLGTGTSQGVPVIACDCEVCLSTDSRDKRLRTSLMISDQDLNIVVDTGPDFRQQMLNAKVKKLDAVLFTHQHKDHTAGMDDIRSFNHRQKKDMPIYARKEVVDQLKQEFAYAFAAKKYPGVPSYEVHELDGHDFKVGHLDITPVEVLHYKLPVYAFRIKDLAYITDANFIAENEMAKLQGLDTLIVNALHHKEHLSHYNLEEALELIKELKPRQAFLTHSSHRMGKYVDIAPTLPENVTWAYDGLEVELDF